MLLLVSSQDSKLGVSQVIQTCCTAKYWGIQQFLVHSRPQTAINIDSDINYPNKDSPITESTLLVYQASRMRQPTR
ncbi:hypothetical protein Y032_0516g2792 [Ancylostoma ceylanicum]|uniref:Uncharacterized protein n=1 Tax=Ancylostoma ceylanicum TaxID=53326 RepID=A0A016WU72_9BILA|nr:hypothetical protein Y032_0516g2792 [Ancylostoma ceylanicum]